MSDAVRVSTVTIDEKCFKQYSGPDTPFDWYNILFGLNGHGKSTLAKAIRLKAISDGMPTESVRTYSAKYVRDTLLIKEGDGRIASVKANFGADNTDIEEQVSILEGEIATLQGTLNGIDGAKGLVSQSQDCLDDIQSEIKTIHTGNKGKTTIKLKFSDANPFEIKTLSAYEADYEAGLKKFKKDVIATSSGDDNHEENLERVNGINIHTVGAGDQLHAETIKEAVAIMNKTYGGTTPNTDELDWLTEGLHLHDKTSKCKFCLNEANIAEIKARIESYQGDTKVSDMIKLKGIIATLNTYTTCVDNLLLAQAEYRELYKKEDDYDDAFASLEGYGIAIAELRSHLEDKLKDNNITDDQLSAEYYYTALSFVEAHCEELEELKQTASAETVELINLQNTLVRARIGHDIKESEIIDQKKNDHIKLDKDIAAAKKEIEEKRGAVKKLKSSKSEIANFANYVNGVLKSLGFDFWLEPDSEDKSYELKHINNTPISIDDISEGEKNLLALLYFYFEMLQDDEKSLKSDIKLIIIDDPIASLDDDNRFYILETVKSLFDHKDIQLFVFTHLWSSFCDLAFGKNGQTSINLYEIIKSNSSSSVVVSTAQEQPYKRMYADIWNFSQADINSIGDDTFLHMPNTIRRVLEDYIRFYAGIKNATSNSKGEIAKILLNEDYDGMGQTKKLQLTTLLSVANILSHRVPGNPSKKEIHDSAKFMMNKMRANHKRHHDAMKTLNI